MIHLIIGTGRFVLSLGVVSLMFLLSGCGVIEVTLPVLAGTFEINEEVSTASFTPDGTMLAIGVQDGTVQLWDVAQGEQVRVFEGHHTNSVTSLEFSADGEVMVTGSVDRTIGLWQVSDGTLIDTIADHDNTVSDVALASDGERLASASWDTTAKIWQVSDGTLLQTLEHHPYPVSSVSFAPESEIVATTAGAALYLWRIAEGEAELLGRATGHSGVVFEATFANDGETIITVGQDNTARTWQTSDGSLLRTFELGRLPHAAAFTANGQYLAVGTDIQIQFWHYNNQQRVDVLDSRGNVTFAMSPDGSLVLTTEILETVQVWDMPDAFMR